MSRRSRQQSPTPDEIEYARLAAQTPHIVLSSDPDLALWPRTISSGDVDEIAALKQQPGKNMYLVGGRSNPGRSLIDAGTDG